MAPAYPPSETSFSDDLGEYDVISEAGLESSLTDLGISSPREIPPSAEAKQLFETTALSADEVQAYAQRTMRTKSGGGEGTGTVRRGMSHDPTDKERTVRIYVDGVFDSLNVGIVHQFRQAKLSFPSVHLLVGPFTDEACIANAISTLVPHVERCELVRHCRWVDEVLFDAPAVLDASFLMRNRIDYVAIEDGSSINPELSKARLQSYDFVKSLGKSIPTRRTKNVAAAKLRLQEPGLLDVHAAQLTNTPSPPARKLEALPLLSITTEETFDRSSTPPEPKEEFGA